MYKTASQQKIRFMTERGSLSVEQLWDLPLGELDKLAVSLDEEYKNSSHKSFLDNGRRTKDKDIKLRFDIVLDILKTKQEEQEAIRKEKEKKVFRDKILNIIAEKEDDALSKKSLKELRALLEEDE